MVLVVVGAALLVLGLPSRAIKRIFLTPVLIALVAGVLIGPEVLGILDPAAAGDERRVLEELARVTLAVALMGAGLQITSQDILDNRRRAAHLLSAGMIGMWAMTGLGAWLLLDLPFWAGMLLGAVLTPTDPVVASTLVTGPMAEQNLPRHTRRTLQMESGANDGLAAPFVLLAAFMLLEPPGTAMTDWLIELPKTLGIAIVAGAALGHLTAVVMESSLHSRDIEETSMLGEGLALALLTMGAVSLLGGSGVLAVFVAAIAFSRKLEGRLRRELGEMQETVTTFLILPVFIFLGAVLPWSDWAALGLPGLLFAGWVLIMRRPVVAWLALRRTDTAAREVAFLAWFGPVGVAGVFYAVQTERLGVEQSDPIFAAATLAICASVLIHSITATPGVRLLAGRDPFAPLRAPLHPKSKEMG